MIGLKSESKRSANQTECGQALILFVLSLAVLLGFVAMSVDVGLILHERRQLQNTADAAALAGVIELPQSPVLAQSKAQEWAANNGIDLAAGDEIQITVDPVNNAVEVEVTRETSFIFGRVLGLTTVDVSASATAQMGSPSTLSGILPFGVLESAISYDDPVVLKYDAGNPTNGNFGALRIDGNGASVHEETIMYGSDNSVCGKSQPTCEDAFVKTQTGNLIGATRDGFNFRFANTNEGCDEFDEVLLATGNGDYKVNGTCNPFTGNPNSMRLVLIPVIDSFCNGNCDVEIQRFVALFLNELDDDKCQGNSCEITGKFVKTVVDPTNDATLGIYDDDSGVKFVRLVE